MQGEALDPLQEAGPLGRALGRAALHLVAGVAQQRHAGEHLGRAARQPDECDEQPARGMTHVEPRDDVATDDACMGRGGGIGGFGQALAHRRSVRRHPRGEGSPLGPSGRL